MMKVPTWDTGLLSIWRMKIMTKLLMTVLPLLRLARMIQKLCPGDARLMKLWTRLSRLVLMQRLFTMLIQKNKAIEPFLFRLHAKVQARINEMSTTANKVTRCLSWCSMWRSCWIRETRQLTTWSCWPRAGYEQSCCSMKELSRKLSA